MRSASTTPQANNMLTNSPSHVSAARPELITHMLGHTHTHTFRFSWLTRGLATEEKTNSMGHQIDSPWLCGWDERAEKGGEKEEIVRIMQQTTRQRERGKTDMLRNR